MAQTYINSGQLLNGSITADKLSTAVQTALSQVGSNATDIASLTSQLTAVAANLQTVSDIMSTDQERIDAIAAVTSAFNSADSTLQSAITSLVTATKTGAGLESDGALSLTGVPAGLSTTATSLKGLVVDAYKSLLALITGHETRIAALETTVAGVLSVSKIVNEEEIAPVTTGVYTTYNLARSAVRGTIKAYVNGVRYREGASNDYVHETDVATHVTFNQALSPSDIVVVDYIAV